MTYSAITDTEIAIWEGDGTGEVTFTLSISPATELTATVHISTADGTALAGIHYVSLSETVTFPAGASSQTITITVFGDRNLGPDRTLELHLSDPLNLFTPVNPIPLTIRDDDTFYEYVPALFRY